MSTDSPKAPTSSPPTSSAPKAAKVLGFNDHASTDASTDASTGASTDATLSPATPGDPFGGAGAIDVEAISDLIWGGDKSAPEASGTGGAATGGGGGGGAAGGKQKEKEQEQEVEDDGLDHDAGSFFKRDRCSARGGVCGVCGVVGL